MRMHKKDMRAIDIGANILDDMFNGMYHGKSKHDSDVKDILQRAINNGVDHVIITAGSLVDSTKAIKFMDDMKLFDENLFTTIGVHPTRCNEIVYQDYDSLSKVDTNNSADTANSSSMNVKSGCCEKEQSNNQEEEAEGSRGGKKYPVTEVDLIHQKKYLSDMLKIAKEGMKRGKIVAIGELGLDSERTHFCHMDTQAIGFEMQLQLAAETGLPLFLHQRNAFPKFCEIIERNRDKIKGGGVVHSFDGTLDEAMHYINKYGFMIGLNGCSLRTDESLEVAKKLPIESILIETDAPWCSIKPTHPSFKYVDSSKIHGADIKEVKPEAWKPNCRVKGRSEPIDVYKVAQVIASVKNMDIYEFLEQVYENTFRLFWPNKVGRKRTSIDNGTNNELEQQKVQIENARNFQSTLYQGLGHTQFSWSSSCGYLPLGHSSYSWNAVS